MSARSHPPSLVRLAERLIRDERLFGRGDVVLCACSGGPDSSALLHTLALLRGRIGHTLVACGVDHGLRAEAAAELDLARAVAEPLGVPFTVAQVAVAPGQNLQARARDARLAALARAAAAAGARVIATGHTADDRAETLVLRLLRGAGPRGLAVLPPRARAPVPSSVDLVRPLLRARRGDVLAHLARHHLPFASDPSNQDPRFTRVRVRREVLPLLETLSPAVVEHLCALADMLAPSPPSSLPHEAPPEGADSPGAPGLVAAPDAGAVLEGLGRAQRLAVERARRLGRPSVRLRLPGGREVEVTFPEGRVVLIETG